LIQQNATLKQERDRLQMEVVRLKQR